MPFPVTILPQFNFLLKFVSRVLVPATTSKFVAKDKFVVNIKRNAPMKINYLSDNFTTWFLDGDGKTEDPITEQIILYHMLRYSSIHYTIITKLGGAEKAETTLFEMFSLMEQQRCGKDGTLLNNGLANLFYIKDSAGVLRAVSVHWRKDGWNVHAYSVENLSRWDDGTLVFSLCPTL